MKSFDFFSNAGWDIIDGWADPTTTTDVWGICAGSGRPFLLWQFTTDACAPAPEPDAPSEPETPSTPDSPSTPETPSTPDTPSTSAPTTTPAVPTPAVTNPTVGVGENVVLVNGQPVTSSIAFSGGSTFSGTVGTVNFSLSLNSNSSSSSQPTLIPGASFQLSLSGLRPGGESTATIYSTPTSLGRFTAGADGSLNTSVVIPSGLESGSHRLRFEMVDRDGQTITVWLGVEVAPTVLSLPATGGSTNSVILIATWLMLAGCGVILTSRGRRTIGRSRPHTP